MSRHNRGLLIIAMFKWLSAVLLCAIAIGLINFAHHDPADVVEDFIGAFNIDPDNPVLNWTLQKLAFLDQKKAIALSVISFAYGAILLIEGGGLYAEKRWAEYLTIAVTASLLPFEIYELAKKIDPVRIVLLVINVAILVFLIIVVRKKTESSR